MDKAPRRQVVDLFQLLQPTDRAAPRGFYPAVGRSSSLRCPASHSNLRKRSTKCETCANNSSRPPFRRSRYKQTIAPWIGRCRRRSHMTRRTQCFCRPIVVRHVDRCGVRVRCLRRKQCARPAALAIVGAQRGCGQGTISIGLQGVGRDIAGIEIAVLRHVEVRRVALHERRLDGVCEHGVGPFPRATIDCDGAVQRIGLEVWDCRAALGQLRNLSSRKCDVHTWHEHRCGRGPCVIRQASQPDTNTASSWERPRFVDSILHGRKELSASPGPALRTTAVRRPIAARSAHASPSGSTVSAQAVTSVRRSIGIHSDHT